MKFILPKFSFPGFLEKCEIFKSKASEISTHRYRAYFVKCFCLVIVLSLRPYMINLTEISVCD